MHFYRAQFLLLLALSLSACGQFKYNGGSSESSESSNFGDNGQQSAPVITAGAGGDVEVDARATAQPSGGELESNSPVCVKLVADGPGGFTFKPNSESDDNLAILPPVNVKIDEICALFSVEIDGELVSQEDECSTASPGSRQPDGREVFRFKMPGGSYFSSFRAVVDGVSCGFTITDTSQRVDKSAARR